MRIIAALVLAAALLPTPPAAARTEAARTLAAAPGDATVVPVQVTGAPGKRFNLIVIDRKSVV